jgi:hypothetical protein
MAEITELEKIADKERQTAIARNEYNDSKGYGVNNPNALSDGDEKGKGQVGDDGTIGSLTDINTRKDNTGRNTFSPNFEYNSTNPDALTPIGKGQTSDTGNVGDTDDINARTDNTGRNKFNTNKVYPDFVI